MSVSYVREYPGDNVQSHHTDQIRPVVKLGLIWCFSQLMFHQLYL